MKSFKWLAVAALSLLALAPPAHSAVVIDSSATNFQFNVDYTGHVGGSYTTGVSALSTFTFTGLSNNDRTYNFNYSITNDSDVSSRLRSFGFNEVSATTLSNISSTGAYAYAERDANYPEGFGNIEICFAATGNGTCTGGSDGLSSDLVETGTGTFALTLSQAVASLALDDFIVRFQSINPTINGSSSGVGIGTVTSSGVTGLDPVVSAAPEPMTWAMMILGFGLIGLAMRQRAGRALMVIGAR